MVEAANRCAKILWTLSSKYEKFGALQPALDFIVSDYNNNRPNNTIFGLTPFEVMENKSVQEIFLKTETAITKSQRIVENKKSKCCNYSF